MTNRIQSFKSLTPTEHDDRKIVIFSKGLQIINSCRTPEHCVVAYNWLKLAERELEGCEILLRHLNESYLTKIMQTTGLIGD